MNGFIESRGCSTPGCCNQLSLKAAACGETLCTSCSMGLAPNNSGRQQCARPGCNNYLSNKVIATGHTLCSSCAMAALLSERAKTAPAFSAATSQPPAPAASRSAGAPVARQPPTGAGTASLGQCQVPGCSNSISVAALSMGATRCVACSIARHPSVPTTAPPSAPAVTTPAAMLHDARAQCEVPGCHHFLSARALAMGDTKCASCQAGKAPGHSHRVTCSQPGCKNFVADKRLAMGFTTCTSCATFEQLLARNALVPPTAQARQVPAPAQTAPAPKPALPQGSRPMCGNEGCNNLLSDRILAAGGTLCSQCASNDGAVMQRPVCARFGCQQLIANAAYAAGARMCTTCTSAAQSGGGQRVSGAPCAIPGCTGVVPAGSSALGQLYCTGCAKVHGTAEPLRVECAREGCANLLDAERVAKCQLFCSACDA